MNPALEPIALLLDQATAVNGQIQTLLASNMADLKELQTKFVALQASVAQTDKMLGALAANLADPAAAA